jgi:acid phosphatase type 7
MKPTCPPAHTHTHTTTTTLPVQWFDSSNYDFLAYRSRFHGPAVTTAGIPGGGGLYYAIDVGTVHVVALAGYCPEMTSTSTQPCVGAGSAQQAWLEADLAAVDRAVTPWVIVMFHEPYMNSNTAHPIAKEGAPMQAAVEDVLYKAGVDMVFSGHVHAYERSCRAYKYKCMTDGTGPVYITIGDGGNREGLAKTWVTPQPDWSLFRQASFGHGELTAVNETHMHWVWVQNSAALVPGGALEAGLDDVWVVKGQPSQGEGGQRTLEPVLRQQATA